MTIGLRFVCSLGAVLVGIAASANAQQQATVRPVSLPVRFVENRGQWDDAIRFAAKHGGLDVLLVENGFVVQFRALEPASDAVDGPYGQGRLHAERVVSGAAVRFRLTGGSGAARHMGRSAGGERYNFHLGARSTTGVQGFRAVTWEGARPGIDVEFRESSQGRIEFELQAAAGRAIEDVSFECEGAASLAIGAHGELVASTAAGEIRLTAPRAFEEDGTGGERELESAFEVRGERAFGFAVKGRTASRRLRVDPEISYSTFFGGNGIDAAYGIATGVDGDVYATGYTTSVNLPVKLGAFDTTYNGNYDAYVVRLRSDGEDYEYVTYIGGSAQDQGISICVDAAGAATVVGTTLSIDFPTTLNAYDRTFGFGPFYGDGFVTKLSSSGAQLVYSTYLGGNADDVPQRVVLGPLDNVYVAGWTRSNNFIAPATASSAYDNTYAGTVGLSYGDAFLAVLKFDGTQLLYGTLLGGSGADAAFGIALDSSARVYLTGLAGQGFPKKGAAFQTYAGSGDCFIACVDPNASGAASLVFSDFLGGSKQDAGLYVTIDGEGAVLACGSTSSTNFPTVPGSYRTKYAGGSSDGFVVKMNAQGTQLGFSSFLGGNNADECAAVKVDPDNNVVVAGRTKSGNFPVTPGTFGPKYKGSTDGFICKLSPSGTTLLTSGFLGASSVEAIADLSVVAADDLWVGGTTTSAGFPLTPNAINKKFVTQEAFLTRVQVGQAPILCIDSTASIEVPYDLGKPTPAPVVRQLTNCGSPESNLLWSAEESPDAPWLAESPASGPLVQGAASQGVSIEFDPTGLPIGAHTTTLTFKNDTNDGNVVQIPVLLSVQEIVPVEFFGGETLLGVVPFAGKLNVGTTSAVKGMTLKFSIAGATTPLQPRLQIVNAVGQTVYSKSLANKKGKINVSTKFTASGDYSLLVSGANWTTGDFSIATSVVLPADAKKLTKKNLGSKVDGGPIDLTRQLRSGSLLGVTVEPPKPLGGPLTLTLLDPNGNPVDVSAFLQPFGNQGLQLVDVPIGPPGLYTIRVTGTATKKEKVNIVITPVQPVGTGDLVMP